MENTCENEQVEYFCISEELSLAVLIFVGTLFGKQKT